MDDVSNYYQIYSAGMITSKVEMQRYCRNNFRTHRRINNKVPPSDNVLNTPSAYLYARIEFGIWPKLAEQQHREQAARVRIRKLQMVMHCKVKFAASDGGSKLIISSPETDRFSDAIRMRTIKSRRAIKISPEAHQCNIAILHCALESLLLHVQEVSNFQSQN